MTEQPPRLPSLDSIRAGFQALWTQRDHIEALVHLAATRVLCEDAARQRQALRSQGAAIRLAVQQKEVSGSDGGVSV